MNSLKKVVIGLVCACIVLCFAVFLFLKQSQQIVPTSATSAIASKANIPTDTKRFVHPSLQFSLVVPKETQIEVRQEAGGAETDIFSMPEPDDRQFQLFILPYKEQSIGSDRIAKDTHGTESDDITEILINGDMHALAFTSSDPVLGKLREIWFIAHGHLIEATTKIENDAWLAKMLKTFSMSEEG